MRQYFKHRNFYLVGLILVAIGLSLSPALMSIGQAVLVLNWIIETEFAVKWDSIKNNYYLQAFLGIFTIHILGLLYTSNFEYAINDLKIKLPLLIFPIIIASTKQLSWVELRFILYCLIVSVFASSIYSLIIYSSTDIGKVDTLRNISPIISHIRLSLIICLSLFAIIHIILKSGKKISSALNIVLILIAIWFFIFIGILGARAGYLALLSCSIIIFIYQIVATKKWNFVIILISATILLPILMYKYVPSVSQRVSEVTNEINQYKDGGNPSGHSITQRFEYWKIAKHIFVSNPIIGVGTGDINDEFKLYYETHDTPIKKEFQFRAHNQYFTILCTFGILGFAIFIFAFIQPYFKGIHKYSLLPTVYIIITMLSMLTEDTLETQAGATFVSFFFSIFLLSAFKRK
ncbi:MAG: O-antigen ligase family protein [Sphingobacteriales bacterium]|nr:O-antigen ligase family protein [Sphingobacteriales bacterium]